MTTTLFTLPTPLAPLGTHDGPPMPLTAPVAQEGDAPHPTAPTESAHEEAPTLGTGVDLGTLTGRRITLKPRRTLSLSPTPARTGDMSMGRNLRAARRLDCTDKDDDDGLYQPSDSDSESTAAKKKGDDEDENTASSGVGLKARLFRRGIGVVGALGAAATGVQRRASVSVKRPLDHLLPCQEIQYLDISYQKVGTVTHIIPQVQFGPIPRKKIAYHPVLHNSIHYCDVPYCGTGERPIKRKPLQRSHSIAVADLRERVDCEWTTSYKLR